MTNGQFFRLFVCPPHHWSCMTDGTTTRMTCQKCHVVKEIPFEIPRTSGWKKK